MYDYAEVSAEALYGAEDAVRKYINVISDCAEDALKDMDLSDILRDADMKIRDAEAMIMKIENEIAAAEKEARNLGGCANGYRNRAKSQAESLKYAGSELQALDTINSISVSLNAAQTAEGQAYSADQRAKGLEGQKRQMEWNLGELRNAYERLLADADRYREAVEQYKNDEIDSAERIIHSLEECIEAVNRYENTNLI